MSASSPVTCPHCGAPASGNFCANCGKPIGNPTCTGCGAQLSPGARFCHVCGTAAPGASAGPGSGPGRLTPTPAQRAPWIIAGIIVIAIVVIVAISAKKRPDPAAPNMGNAGNATATPSGDLAAGAGMRAPNIDSLSPKERFIRLQTRIDQQMERRDTTRLAFFMQMALQAYTMLPETDRDIDVRFHAAMLQAEAGMLPAARALADTIMKQSPDNLFGYYIRATVAEFDGDSTQAKSARAAFRAHYDSELKKNRPEYAEHRPFLEQYRNGDGAK